MVKIYTLKVKNETFESKSFLVNIENANYITYVIVSMSDLPKWVVFPQITLRILLTKVKPLKESKTHFNNSGIIMVKNSTNLVKYNY